MIDKGTCIGTALIAFCVALLGVVVGFTQHKNDLVHEAHLRVEVEQTKSVLYHTTAIAALTKRVAELEKERKTLTTYDTRGASHAITLDKNMTPVLVSGENDNERAGR